MAVRGWRGIDSTSSDGRMSEVRLVNEKGRVSLAPPPLSALMGGDNITIVTRRREVSVGRWQLAAVA